MRPSGASSRARWSPGRSATGPPGDQCRRDCDPRCRLRISPGRFAALLLGLRFGASRLGTIRPAYEFSSGGASGKEPVHAPSFFFRSARLRHRRPPRVVCKRPIPEPRDNCAGFLGGGISAGYSRGTISSAPKHNPRSGSWRKYSTSAIRHRASFPVDTRSAIDIGGRFEIAIGEMIQRHLARRPAGQAPSPHVSGKPRNWRIALTPLPKPKWAEEVCREDSCGLRDIL